MTDIMTREELVLAIERRDGLNCFLCKGPFSKDVNNPLFEVTIDHWYPQSIGFAEGWTYEEVNDLSNLRKAHRPCNAAKGDLIPNPDGTLPERPSKDRTIRLPRPMSCDTCMNGRILLIGETCPDCNSGPQPKNSPRATQKRPKDCSHSGIDHCWMCFIGHVPRKSALAVIITGE